MSDEHDHESAMPTIQELTLIVDSHSTDSDPEMRLTVADAFIGRARIYVNQGDHTAADSQITLIVDSYSADTQPAMRAKVSATLFSRGDLQTQQGNYAAASAAYRAIVNSYITDSATSVRLEVAKALFMLGHVSQKDESANSRVYAISIWNMALETYGDDSEPEMHSVLADIRTLRDQIAS